MVFTIYGHGGHLEFRIMTHFSLVFYIYHINAKYEISLKLAHKNFMYVRVYVSEILRHFSQLYPTHSRLFYDLTGTILAILSMQFS